MGGVLAMTLTATYISASSFIGGPGAAYKYGWLGIAGDDSGAAIWLSLGILGKKFAILARRYNAITLNDMLFARYQSRAVVWIASSACLSPLWVHCRSLSAVRVCWKPPPGLSTKPGCSSSGSHCAVYRVWRFRASVLNDTMQGMVMLIGTLVLLVGVIYAAGGLHNAVQTLERLTLNWSAAGC
jgi:sodium/pantothenate symporter